MLTTLLKKFGLKRDGGGTNGSAEPLDPPAILLAGYRDLSRLAEQIQSHAEKAPYPHIAQRLRQVAAEKREAANTLRVKILSLGGAVEARPFELRSGQNHWERMVRDLADQRALETRFLQRATRLAEAAPDHSDLLKRIVAGQARHKELLLDLVARADPQAEQT